MAMIAQENHGMGVLLLHNTILELMHDSFTSVTFIVHFLYGEWGDVATYFWIIYELYAKPLSFSFFEIKLYCLQP
jgi:hypothetical protein